MSTRSAETRRWKPYSDQGTDFSPYVQRVVIVMLEKGIDFERIDIDLDNKPTWLGDVSPGRQVPVFWAGRDEWLFGNWCYRPLSGSGDGGGLMPSDPCRARHEAWMGLARTVHVLKYRRPHHLPRCRRICFRAS